MSELTELAPKPIPQEEKLMAELKEVFSNEWFARTANDLKEHDRETYDHSLRVGVLASRIGDRLGLPQDIMKKSGVSHDFGKIHVPLRVLQKEGPLTEDEKITMDTHADLSFLMVQPHDSQVAKVIVAHHEYQERSYPRKSDTKNDGQAEQRGEESDSLQMMQLALVLADLTDAWMSKRHYKDALSPAETKDRLTNAFAAIKQSGKVKNPDTAEKFDEDLVDFAVHTRQTINN